MPITDPSQEYFKDGTWGWDGTRWQKLPLVWGYTEALRLSVSDADSAAGTVVLNTGKVPAGEVWIAQSIQMRDRTTASSRMEIQLRNGGYLSSLAVDYSPGLDQFLTQSGAWLMEEDDYLAFVWYSVVLHDHIDGYAIGYKMKVT